MCGIEQIGRLKPWYQLPQPPSGGWGRSCQLMMGWWREEALRVGRSSESVTGRGRIKTGRAVDARREVGLRKVRRLSRRGKSGCYADYFYENLHHRGRALTQGDAAEPVGVKLRVRTGRQRRTWWALAGRPFRPCSCHHHCRLQRQGEWTC